MSAENKAFWKQYDLLLLSLETQGLSDIYNEVNEAKKCVNGYPDGWSRLFDKLKHIESTYRDHLVSEQRTIFYYLITQLKASLHP
jgi:hypothetical protein